MGLLGKNFNQLSFKARSLLRNLNEINRLIWLLINQDCVAFFTYLSDLRFNINEDQISIFTFCDDETMKLIEKLYKIAKERVFTLHLKKQKEGRKE